MKSGTATLTIPGREPITVDVPSGEVAIVTALRLIGMAQAVALKEATEIDRAADIVMIYAGTQWMSYTIPIKTISEANRASHEHWRHRQTRAKVQRSAGFGHTLEALRGARPSKDDRLTIRITRIGPRRLDSDNLAGSQKHIRDGIAKALGIDDGSDRIEWTYAQRKGKPKEYAVEVEIWRR